MGTEASKTRAIWAEDLLSLMQGDGIDIGCGVDPIFPSVDRFDQEDGDANAISQFVKKKYDFVFSSHCLEHMRDPVAALREWFSLVKPGGHLIVLVPDEDLYEQGTFPSAFNSDHKFTFTMKKVTSWSPRSVNVLDLPDAVEGQLVSAMIQDQGYDRSWMKVRPSRWSRRMGRIAAKCARKFPQWEVQILGFFRRVLGALVDQTSLREPRLAQIQFVIQKPAA